MVDVKNIKWVAQITSIFMLWMESDNFEIFAHQLLMNPLLNDRPICQLSDNLSDNIQVVYIHFTRGACKKTGTSTCPNFSQNWFSCDISKTVSILP